MKRTKRFPVPLNHEGSVLILVLWVLALIVFLAGDYLAHNRGKAGLAEHAWQSIRQRQAVYSVVNLFASDVWPIPGQIGNQEKWFLLSPSGVDLWVRVDAESDKIHLNTDAEYEIREKIRQILGRENTDEADHITDAILDWRDADDLVRTNGAEADYYETQNVPYRPANGPFKVLTELLLTRGVSADLFWGDPMNNLMNRAGQNNQQTPVSLIEAFTIYGEGVKRVTVLVPIGQKGYTFIVAVMKKKDGQWNMIQVHQSMRLLSEENTSA